MLGVVLRVRMAVKVQTVRKMSHSSPQDQGRKSSCRIRRVMRRQSLQAPNIMVGPGMIMMVTMTTTI